MASYLADTNLLLRIADPASPQHPIATDALACLLARGDEVYLTPQNFTSSGRLPRARLKRMVLGGAASGRRRK